MLHYKLSATHTLDVCRGLYVESESLFAEVNNYILLYALFPLRKSIAKVKYKS